MQSGVRHFLLEALSWSAIAIAGVVGFIYFDDLIATFDAGSNAMLQEVRERPAQRESSQGFEREVRIPADRSGHFEVDAHINDRPVSLIADTGATLVVLTYEDAREAGLGPSDLQFTHETQTANGVAKVAPVMLDRVRVGDIELRDVRAVVSEPGKLHVSLLGMSFLGALTSFQMQGRELVLVQ
jgi:aspartyl protease family protein